MHTRAASPWCRVRDAYATPDIFERVLEMMQHNIMEAALTQLSCHGNDLLMRANQNIAIALSKLQRPIAALGYATQAYVLTPDAQGAPEPDKAYFRAGEACAALHMPQAASFFLTSVRVLVNSASNFSCVSIAMQGCSVVSL